ncbi:hypothetical protein BDW02DRAFT_634748 [Decorospora gaudefroyi]|uniref:Uncharacterized protein n=1 Tax=Decorospora gaudefroyi TaxID=184978 RepID=A0A6A5JWM8_9PLEO|nr:hypothetical protein BDW02DRAFT_634748 [Decorospora gaudefroyi]
MPNPSITKDPQYNSSSVSVSRGRRKTRSKYAATRTAEQEEEEENSWPTSQTTMVQQLQEAQIEDRKHKPSNPSSKPRNTAPGTAVAGKNIQTNGSGSVSNSEAEDWQDITHPVPLSLNSPSTYAFPGTWPAALHDTKTALTSVAAATSTYATALSRSGLFKASLSIGSAALSSTNSVAVSVAGWGMRRSGRSGGWRGEERFVDGRGAFVLDTRDGGREVRGEEGWVEQRVRGGVGVRGGYVEDEDEEEEEEGVGDGLIRVFEFDSE